jgi:hypothetical protein
VFEEWVEKHQCKVRCASAKSSEKRASSRRSENGQRLTGYVGNPYLITLRQSCPSSAQNRWRALTETSTLYIGGFNQPLGG